MNDSFMKNLAVFSEEEMQLLAEKRVFVAGCGGLGGSVIELLARSGVGHLTLADNDRFESTNMNRQILCTADTLGQEKAQTAAQRVLSINPEAHVQPVVCRLEETNTRELIRGHDLVIDALDSVSSRLMLEDACAQEGIFLIHGAVNGWFLQVGVCPPGAGMLHALYNAGTREGYPGTGIAVTVFTCASFQVSEALKVLLHRPDSFAGRMVFSDLLSKESDIIRFTDC